jgi:addiction module HigA family antidote
MAKPYKEPRSAAEKKTQRMALASDITEKLFGEAPLHLKKPQVDELTKLDQQQLLLIAQIKRFPISKSLRGKIVSALGSEILITRMEKRWRIASAVISAEREGLYEAAEHATGMLDLGDEFSIGPIQFSAEGAKALVELMENPPKPSPALSQVMGKVNKSGSSIEKEKLRKQMEEASRDFLFMKDLDESMKVFEAVDTKTASKKAKRNKHAGSNFDDFLKEEGMLKESEAVAIKRVEELRQAPYPTLGEILLEEFLKPLKISQARLAKETGIPKKHIEEIITGKRVIDLHDAKAIGEFLKTGPEFWINLQAPIAQTSHADLRKKTKPMKTSSAKLIRKDRNER